MMISFHLSLNLLPSHLFKRYVTTIFFITRMGKYSFFFIGFYIAQTLYLKAIWRLSLVKEDLWCPPWVLCRPKTLKVIWRVSSFAGEGRPLVPLRILFQA